MEGPVDLPFDHHDIRVYIDNLQASIPAEDAKHTEWFHFARGWAEMLLLVNDQAVAVPEPTGERIKNFQTQVDAGFAAWLFKRYAGLINLPPAPPVMLHLPRFFARQMGEDRNSKIALIVMDGPAMDQWLVVRSALAPRQPGFRFREQAVFAWIPSLTSVSRQAAFAGKAPIFFPNSIQTTEKEPALWAQFWADHQVGQWAKQPYLNTLLDLLLDRGFRVYLPSDHGNVEAEGCGRPSEEAVADLRGERVRIYPDAILRGKVKERFPAAIEWGAVGLPEEYVTLLAPARQAFVQEKQRTVSHGGVSVEELVVPLVQIERAGQ